MGVAAPGGVFHQPGIAKPDNLRAPVTHADLHFAPHVEHQASLDQRVDVHGPQRGTHVAPDLRNMQPRAQRGVLRQLEFFHMAFAIRPGVDTIDAPASIMASATPFCFCTTQKHLAVKRSRSSMA